MFPSAATDSGTELVLDSVRSCRTDVPSAESAALNSSCVTKLLALAAGVRTELIVVGADALFGGILDCGCCGAIEVGASLAEGVAVSGSGSVANAAAGGRITSDGGYFGAC